MSDDENKKVKLASAEKKETKKAIKDAKKAEKDAKKATKSIKTEKKSKKSDGGSTTEKKVKRHHDRPQIIGAFLERGGGVKLIQLLHKQGVFLTMTFLGKGTATSEILDILGLEDAERDVVISVATNRQAKAVMGSLNDRLARVSLGKGIAFRMPLSAAPNRLLEAMTVKSGASKTQSEGSNGSMEAEKFSLILLAVNQGYADEVMAVAKAAGARGGTLIRALQTDSEEAQGLFGSTFSAEREIIAVLATADKRNAIMDAVNVEHGMRTETDAVAIALSVDDVAKLS